MRVRWKILITILLAVLYVFALDRFQARQAHASAMKCENLKAFYDDYNQLYFNNVLPPNTVVDYGEYNDDFMATTNLLPSKQFHIALNEKYAQAARVAHLLLLHEMCHIKTWNAPDDSDSDHSKSWRTCMLILEIEGANRAILIDAYTGR